MKRSFRVTLPLVSAVAASLGLSACNQQDEWQAQTPSRICTDAEGRRIMDAECQRGGTSHWYYYAAGAAIVAHGQRAYGGSFQPRPGVAYASPTKVSRGGFGSSARGFSGGG